MGKFDEVNTAMTEAKPDNLDTFLTSLKVDGKAQSRRQNREDLLRDVPIYGGQILTLHEDLNRVAEELDRNVDMLLSHHEQDFFAAYKQHMAQVQKDYRDLKQKADQNETRARRDHKIKELEKELDWFKLEALRLDELCKKYTKQLEHWKIKADALGDDVGFLEDQIKNAKKQNVVLREAVTAAKVCTQNALVLTFSKIQIMSNFQKLSTRVKILSFFNRILTCLLQK